MPGTATFRSAAVSVADDQMQIDSRAQWREWLLMNAGSGPGIRLVTWKKGSGP